MPYSIRKVKGGYKVASPNRTFSKRPLTLKQAKRQLKALYANAKD